MCDSGFCSADYEFVLFVVIIVDIIYSYHSACLNHNTHAITAGVAVLLTIITYFSSPILTTIFGDGSLEVSQLNNHENILF